MTRASAATAVPKSAAVMLAAVLLLACGSWRGAKTGEPPEPPPPWAVAGPERPAQAPEMPAPPPAAAGPEAPAQGTGEATPQGAAPPVPGLPGGGTEAPAEQPQGPAGAPSAPPGAEVGSAAGPAPPETERAGAAAPGAGPAEGESKPAEGAGKPRGNAGEGAARRGAPVGPGERTGRILVARLPEGQTFDRNGPYWAREREDLVYRVEFLGITMGYARFSFEGKVLLEGREVYHLRVRAWTTSVLAIIYPINDTIDYFMDTRTLEPLRQEYSSGGRKKDDVAIYDQESGRIVYRYKESGEVRKQVDAVPNVYDPVTLAYYFRSRGPGGDERGRNVYAGRKVWEISAAPLGYEKIATDRGEVDTMVIRPVIKRDGRIEDKGDLRMWMTRDARRVPVRLYAKFRKIRTWTLVGELMPERKGG